MKLFVDDRRRGPAGWTTERTITAAIRQLVTGKVQELSVDFDPGYYWYNNGPIQVREESFEPVLMFVLAMPPARRPKLNCHSGSAAKAWMDELIERANKGEVLFP